MAAASGFCFDSAGGDDPLEGRLRSLRWMEAPTDVRERCWRVLDARMSGEQLVEEGVPTDDPLQDGPDSCERHPFRRGAPPRRVTLAERWPPPNGPIIGTGAPG